METLRVPRDLAQEVVPDRSPPLGGGRGRQSPGLEVREELRDPPRDVGASAAVVLLVDVAPQGPVLLA